MSERQIVFDGVSRFYGEVLGVNRVTLRIPPGITSLVGPNGSGKTTLMNLMTGLIAPDSGTISVCGISPRNPEDLMQRVGYATQYDSSPYGATGFDFVSTALLLAGRTAKDAHELAWKAIEQVDLTDAADRKIAGYSKGMRQRIRLAQAIAHDPEVWSSTSRSMDSTRWCAPRPSHYSRDSRRAAAMSSSRVMCSTRSTSSPTT